ncbi:hypothetical protein BU16DRAFT_91678 [Lophium mytilinum]|uniref:Uncharacterized protein n=1 Tax=Lophium mytilinum TaxID=390894 RepID=A0A6A6QL49_9PEZI|nr:hypothetical protein BU16DRAFT_91678 [Lophium mytilinum]
MTANHRTCGKLWHESIVVLLIVIGCTYLIPQSKISCCFTIHGSPQCQNHSPASLVYIA